jgi:hypothetical protein
MFRASITTILLLVFLAVFDSSPAIAQEGAKTTAAKDTVTYTLRYQRWGDFGSYHLGMKLSMIKNGTTTATWYMNGGWDTTFAHDTLLVYQIPALFPVFLKAYVHPTHPTSPLFNIRKWDEFGPTMTVSNETAMKLVTMSHAGMSKINAGEFMYSPIVKPFKLGEMGFWTSNSYVASLIHWSNETGQNIRLPVGGAYPGIDGPFIPKTVFEACK